METTKKPDETNALLGEFQPSAALPDQNWRSYFPEIIGRSKSIRSVLETVSRIASSDSSVLIYGESGTGKELIASALHRLSPRSNKRFVAINCSAIPESLLESELFGYEKGAFTGAHARRKGHFELAEGGTLFLDEIGDMPQALQSKLLRILQEKQYTCIGGSELKSADVRIITATNVNLADAVTNGEFRLDLFYRLNVLPITLPPLRERTEDIVDLIEHFTKLANKSHATSSGCYFEDNVIDCLKAYKWPGNIRELQNLVERLVVLRKDGAINLGDLPEEYRSEKPLTITNNSSPEREIVAKTNAAPEKFGKLPDEGLKLTSFIENLENDLIRQALDRTGNNKNQAAKLLGLNRTTLVERIKKRKLGKL